MSNTTELNIAKRHTALGSRDHILGLFKKSSMTEYMTGLLHGAVAF